MTERRKCSSLDASFTHFVSTEAPRMGRNLMSLAYSSEDGPINALIPFGLLPFER